MLNIHPVYRGTTFSTGINQIYSVIQNEPKKALKKWIFFLSDRGNDSSDNITVE